jgi:hypothetical protein
MSCVFTPSPELKPSFYRAHACSPLARLCTRLLYHHTLPIQRKALAPRPPFRRTCTLCLYMELNPHTHPTTMRPTYLGASGSTFRFHPFVSKREQHTPAHETRSFHVLA